MSTPGSILRKIGKWLGITLLVVLGILLILVLLIRTEWAQNKIVGYATEYVSGKTGSRIEIDRIFITFRGNVQVEGLYLEDQKKDTLIYFNSLEAGVGISSLIERRIAISRIDLDGLRANVSRSARDSSFNFDFIIDAFASGDTTNAATTDTTAKPPPSISLGPVHFTDFKINYLDSLAGMEAYLDLGTLELSTDELDLQESRFELDEILLENTQARLVQFLSPPPSDDTTSSAMPYLSFEEIALHNVELSYTSLTDSTDTRARLQNFTIGESTVDLPLQNISVESVVLQQSNIRFRTASAKVDTTVETTTDTTGATTFAWPDWKVELNELLLEDNRLEFHQGSGSGNPGVFDPQHIAVRNFTLDLEDVSLKEREANLELKELTFTERSGFHLEKMAFAAQINDQDFRLQDLQLLTNNSQLNAQLNLSFNSIDSLLANPQKNSRFALALGETSLSIKDAYYFADSLQYDTLIQRIENYPLQLSGNISGSLEDLTIERFKAHWLNSTDVLVHGKVENFPDTNNLRVNLPQLDINTTATDLGLILGRENPDSTLPGYINLKTSIKGNAADLTANLDIRTPDGIAKLQAEVKDILKTPSYAGELEVDTLNIGKFTQNPELQPVSLELAFNGSGKTLETLQLQAELTFQQLIFRDYNYQGFSLAAEVANKNADVTAQFSDENLDFTLDVNGVLDTVNTIAELSLDLSGADLKDLNLQANPMRVAGQLNASFEGNPNDFKSWLTLKKAIIIKNDDAYRLDSLYAGLENSTQATDFRISSDIIDGQLMGNTSIQKLVSSLETYKKRLMGKDTITRDSIYQNLDMSAEFTLANSPLLSDVLLPDLSRLDTIKLGMAFIPSREILRLELRAPEIVYGESELSQLSLDLDATPEKREAKLSFDHLSSGPVDIYRTELDLNMQRGEGLATLSILDALEQEVVYTSVEIEQTGEITELHVKPDKLVLNSNAWEILPNNQIRLEPELTRFRDFEISRNNQRFSAESITEEEKEKLLLAFNDFKLEAIFSILNAGKSPVGGTLGGNVTLTDLTGTPAFIADLSLNNLAVMGNEIGTLSLQANNRQADQYVVDLSLKGRSIDLSLDGKYSTAGQSQNLDLNLDIAGIDMNLVEAFFPDQVNRASGGIKGNFTVTGPTSDPQFEGNIEFVKVGFDALYLGTRFELGDEKIKINNKEIYFNSFTINDATGNNMVLNGQVGIEDMTNPSFDLSLKANNFQALNSTREDNDLVYGKAIINLDVDVKGDLNLPVVNASVELARGTEVSYLVPASQAQIQERQGIVRFANMKDSTDILSSEETSTQTITGLDLTVYLKIDPKTTFNIIIDEQSGDQLSITGEANLNYNLSPNGNMDLSGSYELSDGSYQLSLYELVKKRFEVAPGSRIVWSGDPMGAELDLTAIYKVEASPADLMAYQLTGLSATARGRYNQKLPFEVMLYIEGTIEQPEISFGLDMPDNSKDAIGGSVYQRVQQLNEDESELNKQVFALIVFDRFLPSDAVESQGGGTSQLARSSVSKLLSAQLNKLSDKYIEGIELNFDLDSYSDYQTGGPEQRTDLNVSLRKSLFGDRVVVEVGSTVGIEGERRSNDIIGDVSIEYLLTENGRYRLKAFRKNEFQDLVEGQVTITGLSILFTKEFDTLRELLEKQKSKKKEEAGE